MTDIAARTAQIKDRRLELMARMSSVDQELGAHGSPDWEDNAVEHEEDETLEALGLAAQKEILMLDAALKRIEAGEYGFCVTCGNDISEQRLDLLPATPFCRNCAQ
ncbi:TraR/DksA family transcriptional regulator [Roseinatronobacter thiooxidans]|uniref:TraR/DksA family transcriptional regulator n=1 Tax=Roseinatronobacter thiooxidans TaxID=121821 RepID=A0A2W7Q228_9RHOB|nr:TraR/DksA C4-type zinc finger protein [Roseinatronobacter thiooxidans]PZX42003.1 TraR/DksA family transcriptional regulator [Roseinatronobacter thiooxidans]